jgi:iron(III) transport system substrate-binding protein
MPAYHRRSFFNAFTALLILSGCLFGCSKPQKERVIVYSPHGKEMLEYFEQSFEKTHPSLDVVWLDMGAQTVFDRIRTEKENPQADLWWGAPREMFEQAEAQGLLAAYKPSWSQSVPADMKSAKDFWHATFQTPECIMFNTKELTRETAPQDWDELLSEKWQNKIIIRDPMQSGTMRTIFAAMIAKELNRTKSLDSGYAWLLKLHKNTKSYAADPTQLFLKLSRGEASVTLWHLTDALLQAKVNQYPFDFIMPKSGTVTAVEGIAIVSNAKHRKSAELFYEYVTTDSALTIQATDFFRLPVRTDLKIETEWKSKAIFTPLTIDREAMHSQQTAWLKYWQEKIRTN